MITWNTPAGSLGVITERVTLDIPLDATSNIGDVTFSLIAGNLPRGLRLSGNSISGSPTEVRTFTESRFVIRASDGQDIEDRTFKLSVDGSDIPEWITREGFLQVGDNNSYFVLDNSYVNFSLSATDPDLIAGDTLEYYLVPQGGTLPPGLSLSKTGVISGFTDPIFALEYTKDPFGGYDTGPLDQTPLDFLDLTSNGFDSFLYDNQDYDYNEPSRQPRRLSRIYNFVVAVTDGRNTVNRLFKMYVVTEEFLQADTTLIQSDTNLFQADATSDRSPLWITESYLGRIRANNYVTIFLEVYDPPTLPGVITYLKKNTNPDGSVSTLPPGMTLDSTTGEIAGEVPYQAAVTRQYKFTIAAIDFNTTIFDQTYTFRENWNSSTNYSKNDAVRFEGFIYIALQDNRAKTPSDEPTFWESSVATTEKTFTVDIIGEIESAINWITPSDRGTIKPNQPSLLYVRAESLAYGGRVAYDLVSGTLPPGLTFLSSGDIQGKVNQFSDDTTAGLIRFYDRDSSLVDSTASRSFNSTFDAGTTSFDRKFTFTIRARDNLNYAESLRTFTVQVIEDNSKTFANVYVKALQSKEKRLQWFNFITDATIFTPADLYRYGDPNYAVQAELKMLLYAGIESLDAVKFVQAMSRNHYRKRLLFGDLSVAEGKDPITQETLYEAIYVNVVDEYEKNGKSISNTINLPDDINSKVLVSYDKISVDTDIPFVSDSDHQRIFPNSIKNMRNRVKSVGERYRDFLPLWMRSIQSGDAYEPGFVKALTLCYCKPGSSERILAKIRASGFDFKQMDFTIDRYLFDSIDGLLEDKYLAFPQRGEKIDGK
jgi:hypothetical protein